MLEQMVGATTTFASTVASSIASSVMDALAAISGYAIWMVATTLLFSLLYVVQENYSEVLLESVEQWNSAFGPILHRLLFIPLQIIDVMFSAIVPIYNAVVWILKKISTDVVVDATMANLESVKTFGLALGSACKHAATEVPPFINSMVRTCDYALDGDLCYDPGNARTIDLVTVMKDVRTMASALSTVVVGMCGRWLALVNIALFPFMDINLAKAVHNIVNALLYTVFQLPSVTAQRCNNHGPNTKSSSSSGNATQKRIYDGGSILMCIPDLNPPINMMVAGVRNLGVLVDNWLDVSSIIIQRFLNLLTPEQAAEIECAPTPRSLMSPSTMYSRQLFATSDLNRPRVLVGLTDGLYALTDGVHAQYFNHYDSVESMASPNVWPFEIDTRYGVAAVTYRAGSGAEDRDGATGRASTTMLGCRCDDQPGGLPPIRIRCALALKSVATMSAAASSGMLNVSSILGAPQTTFDVVFQQRSTANYMTCAMTQVKKSHVTRAAA